ncbi:MAG: CPBP family intramembrane metalloprotease [Clostridiales bacterium]|nr:CPBP family intramembrane metalloprotease [Clostridiales bacterium]
MINGSEITNKKFGIFMTVAFLAAYIPLSVAGLAYKGGNILLCLFLFRFIAIFIPLIAVIVSGLPFKKLGWKPKFSFKYLIASLIGPQLLSWIGAGIFFAFNKDSFGIGMDSYLAMLPAEVSGMIDTSETSAYACLIMMIIMSLTILPISQILPSLGEEAGWRGVMYPYLKTRLGPVFGKLAGGALWGIWHWPLVILGSYFYEGDYFGKPVLGPVMICISLCAFGVLIDHVYEKTGCIWLPSLMHAAMNSSAMPLMFMLRGGYSHLSILGPNCFGLLGCLPVMVVAAVLVFAKVKKRDVR